jgi:hypothetical protein
MHMYRYISCEFLSIPEDSSSRPRSSLVTGSKSHKTVTSDVSRILWYYYNDPVRTSLRFERRIGLMSCPLSANPVLLLRRERAFLCGALSYVLGNNADRPPVPSTG